MISYNRKIRSQQLTGEGRLKVQTFLGNAGKPAAGAFVQIKSSGSGGSIIEELISDESGRCLPLDLAAPSGEFSMTGDAKPYSQYNITVNLEGFEPQIIEGVQVMPGVTAVQDVYLRPLSDGNGQPRVITVNDHILWGVFPPKTQEEEVKELPSSTGFVVLPDPVVPEFIVVHDGRPDNPSAPNYWVPFADYIKNVASCEIFPTWPVNTITANVLAIISFTLNRVYTYIHRYR